jgi:hypothetical protein
MSASRVRSIDQQLVTDLQESLPTANIIRDEIHLVRTNGVVVTRSVKDAVGFLNGRTYVRGLVDTVPFSIDSQFSLSTPLAPPTSNLLDCTAVITMTMYQPIGISNTWNYKINRNTVLEVLPSPPPVILTPSPPQVTPQPSPAQVAPQPSLTQSMAQGLSLWCVVRCGGKAILKCLLECLPTLIADVTGAAYSLCVLGCAGRAWAAVVDCVVDDCM